METRERFGTSFAVNVTPKRAAGYESRPPVAADLGRHDKIADGKEFGNLRQDFRWEFVDGG